MPPVVIYVCSKCRMSHVTFEAAEWCEDSHLPVTSARSLEYRRGAYPFRVVLTFPDGREREYVMDDGSFAWGGWW